MLIIKRTAPTLIRRKKFDMNVKEDNYRKRMYLGQDGNALVELLMLNAVIFVVLKFVFVFFLLTNASNESFIPRLQLVCISANPEKIAWRPWTLISFMFTDLQLFRFISNMFWLWSFGYILQDLTGNRKLIPFIFMEALVAQSFMLWLIYWFRICGTQIDGDYLSCRQLFYRSCCRSDNRGVARLPDFSYDQRGHSAVDTDTDFPAFKFFRCRNGDMATYLAYAGAAGVGFLFIDQLRRGRDGSIWINQFFDWFANLFNPDKKKKPKNKKDEFFTMSPEHSRIKKFQISRRKESTKYSTRSISRDTAFSQSKKKKS